MSGSGVSIKTAPAMETEKPTPSGDRSSKFKRLSERLSELVAAERVEIAPYETSGLNYFSLLTASDQQLTLTALQDYLVACEAARVSGHSLRDTKSLISCMLERLGLAPEAL